MIFTAPNEGDIYLLYTIKGWKLGICKEQLRMNNPLFTSNLYLTEIGEDGEHEHIWLNDSLAVKVGEL